MSLGTAARPARGPRDRLLLRSTMTSATGPADASPPTARWGRRGAPLPARATADRRGIPVQPRAAVFDWGGTLACTNRAVATACRAATHEILGIGFPATHGEEQQLFQLGETETLRMLADSDATLETLRAALTRHYRGLPGTDESPDEVLSLLAGLRRAGWGVAAISSGDPARIGDEQDRLGLAGLVDVVIGIDDVPSWIPHPAPLRAALVGLGVPPAAAIVVSDSPVVLRTGRSIGMTAALARYGDHGHLVDRTHADWEFVEPADLLATATVRPPAAPS